ncbi:MAG TPA: GNAT family N-acetyltransferase [Solirubrobacteraceae bacterium]|nr:GNAT family N-acetyltransferase [Solirubrobacteraceae bacterium]
MVVRPVRVEQTRALRQAVLRPFMTIGEMDESEPPDAFAVGAFDDDDELVAVGLIGPEGDPGAWRIRGMAAAPAVRGRGAGTAVLDALLEHARSQGAASVWANVRIPARRLYERAGFRPISDEFEEPMIGPHMVMSRTL